MHDRRKKNRLFHVNMLRKWQVREPTDTGYWCEEVPETSEDDLPVWGVNDGSTLTEARLAGRLSQDQRATCKVYWRYSQMSSRISLGGLP